MDPTLIAVGGALAGTALGWVGAVLKDRWQREDEDARRWHDRRLDAYAALMLTVQAIERTANAVAMEAEDDDGDVPAAARPFATELEALWTAAATATLVASQTVERSAWALQFATSTFVTGVLSQPTELAGSAAHHEPVAKAMAVFTDAARTELGLQR